MGEMDSLWGYAERQEMEEKLLLTRYELEKLKAEAAEEMALKNNELYNLLKFVAQERDEAISQLQKLLLNKAAFGCSPNIPLAKPGKANSSITESNSPSETYNYQSPPVVDSLFDAVSSPEFSNSAPFFSSSRSISGSGSVQKADPGSVLIDNLVKGRALPEKGKFLQAVREAGPLLQTVLMAGPLPKWRNPPQLQPFQIPPVPININGCDAADEVFAQKLPAPNVGQLGYYAQKPAHVSSFGNLGFGNCLSNASSTMSYGVPLVKRQRFC